MVKAYGVLRSGRGKINVCLRNHRCKANHSPKQTAVGEIATANVILSLLAPKLKDGDSDRGEATAQKGKSKSQEELLRKNIYQGYRIGVWMNKRRHENRYTSIFTMGDMDLGKTSVVKHSIRLMDNTPFRVHYQSMYEEVCEHLKEMLEIDAV